MRNFFIDYENVQGAGLSSLDKLVVDDSIYIFYSSHAETMRMPFVKMIYQTEAKVEFIEVETGKPNALDFQLVARLFMNISKDADNYIISRDTGFDAAVHVGVINGFRIKRVPSITDAFENNDASDVMENECVVERLDFFNIEPQGVSEASVRDDAKICRGLISHIIADKCGWQAGEQYVDLVVAGVKESCDKDQFFRFLCKNLGDSIGGDLYHSIRGCFNDMRDIVDDYIG